jgi:hypothetical protein
VEVEDVGRGGDVLLVQQRCSDDEWGRQTKQVQQDPTNFPAMYNPDYCINWDSYCDRLISPRLLVLSLNQSPCRRNDCMGSHLSMRADPVHCGYNGDTMIHL